MSTVETRKRGAVMVVGGGIGGIQTSLDLADLGFKVYLVEKEPSIGGNMVKLDKTFPTNDCSMCMISPKLVACARHPNIEIITLAQVEAVKQDAVGNYQVRIIQAPRSVDMEKCTACGDCMEACPVRNIVIVPDEPPPADPLPDEDQAFFIGLLAELGTENKALIPILQHINRRHRYLPPVYLPHVGIQLDIPLARVLRVATFYNSFSLEPVGRHIIEICSGTACHVRGSGRLITMLKQHLKVEAGKTTADERFTLRTVNCIGCCALAPAMKVNDQVFAQVKSRELTQILKDFK